MTPFPALYSVPDDPEYEREVIPVMVLAFLPGWGGNPLAVVERADGSLTSASLSDLTITRETVEVTNQ